MTQPQGGTVKASMPDFVPPSDDDETLEPWFNDQGDFGDIQDLILGDQEDE